MGYSCSLDVGIVVSSNGTARMDQDREQLIHVGTLEIGGGRRKEEEGGGGRRRCTHTCTYHTQIHASHLK